jgi:hypothetical protein
MRVTVPRPFQYPVQPEAAWQLAENSIKMLYARSLTQRAVAAVRLAKTSILSRL